MGTSRKLLFIAITGGLTLLLFYYIVMTQKLTSDSANPTNVVSMMGTTSLDSGDNEKTSSTENNMDAKSLVMEAEDTKVIILEDVTGGGSTGTAYILRREETLYHTVSANLPNLSKNEFYEGWLVKNPDNNEFFSTGAMTKGENNKYELIYSSTQSYEGYDVVVITLEKIADKTPEVHILEGK